MTMFNINVRDAHVKNWLPKHGKSEDAARSGELQLTNVRLLPSSAAALLLAKDGNDVVRAFLSGKDGAQSFWGIGEIVCSDALIKFANRHEMTIDELDSVRVALVNKLRLRFEGGPQQLIYADFSIHLEDVSDEETAYFHYKISRDVHLKLEQAADLVDEMIASAQNMAVETTFPPNGDLLEEQDARDKEQIAQAAKGLGGAESAEVPIRTKRKAPAKKAAGKRAAKKKAAA